MYVRKPLRKGLRVFVLYAGCIVILISGRILKLLYKGCKKKTATTDVVVAVWISEIGSPIVYEACIARCSAMGKCAVPRATPAAYMDRESIFS